MEVVILRYLKLVWIVLKIEEEGRERKGKKVSVKQADLQVRQIKNFSYFIGKESFRKVFKSGLYLEDCPPNFLAVFYNNFILNMELQKWYQEFLCIFNQHSPDAPKLRSYITIAP